MRYFFQSCIEWLAILCVQLVTGDAWDVSEGESDDDDKLAFESDPLDREQLEDLPSDMSPQDDISQEQIAMNVDESSESDEGDSVSESIALNTSTAKPFDPPLFSYPVGLTFNLECDATPLDFFFSFF